MTNSPNYNLSLFPATDTNVKFLDYRVAISGEQTSSNFMIIDTALQNHEDAITALESSPSVWGVNAQYSSDNFYIAGVVGYPGYQTNQIIALSLDRNNVGTVTININSSKTVTVMKYNADGELVNMDDNDFTTDNPVLCLYNGTVFIAIGIRGADMINIEGTPGDVVTISSDNTMGDSGYKIGSANGLATLDSSGRVSQTANNATVASKTQNALTINLNSTSQQSFNGSSAVTVNINPSTIGAATAAQGAKADGLVSGTQTAAKATTAATATSATTATTATTSGTCTGNAASATKLQTARNIGNASFNGTANITLAQIGAATTAQGSKADTAVQSVNGKTGTSVSLTYSDVGALASNGTATAAATCTGNAASATKLQTARKIGNASFNGTADITLSQIGALPSGGTAVAAKTAATCSGNAATATKLATARKIGNASFDGAANITLAQIGAYPAANIRVGFAAGMANGTRSYKLFSKDQINQIFGTSGVDYGPQNMAIFVMNGDFSSGGLVAAITSVWSGGEIYVVNCDLNSTIPAGAHDVVFLAVKFS